MASPIASWRWECAQHVTTLKNTITSTSTSTSTNSTTDIDFDTDPLNLLQLADSVRKRIVFDGLLCVFFSNLSPSLLSLPTSLLPLPWHRIRSKNPPPQHLNTLTPHSYISLALTLFTLVLLTLIPRWKADRNSDTDSERQVKSFPSRALSFTLCLASGSAFLFASVSILWQHLAAVTTSRFIERMSYGGVVAKVGSNAMVIGWLGVLMLWFAFMGCLLMVLSMRKVRRTFG